ncbi:hypothetical protein [Erythrobacter ani]|uniref:Uncharacterized protein n=1 Tax=Erythrobacter ani TaxID=2827235 RepID=A0ABS6SKA6_9SPHN|nr:hypothetical protein [Erythrobacter ani]MBV7265460.1 hypothetical protein [Erythrobacter ani]
MLVPVHRKRSVAWKEEASVREAISRPIGASATLSIRVFDQRALAGAPFLKPAYNETMAAARTWPLVAGQQNPESFEKEAGNIAEGICTLARRIKADLTVRASHPTRSSLTVGA